jgi:hypothetical protein
MAEELDNRRSTKFYRKRWNKLYLDAADWRTYWSDICEYLYPRRGLFLASDTEESGRGEKKGQKIINTRASRARRVAAAGLLGGISSPSRPWFRLALADSDLMEFEPVKRWLQIVRDGMLTVFQRSNYYGAAHNVYGEILSFGYNPMLIDADPKTVIRCRPMTIGEAYVALDDQYRPDTLVRKFWLTTEQLIRQFGEDKVTDTVRTQWRNSLLDERHLVYHIVEPREIRNPKDPGPRNMPYASIYFEDKADDMQFLRISGYRTKPFAAPRWDVTGTDVYGDCPGMEALGDIKQLQKMEHDKLAALAKQVNPPMNAPASMKDTGGTLLPGGINYIDPNAGNSKFEPSFVPQLQLNNLSEEIRAVEMRIREHFYEDLFLAVLNENKQMTATEVAQRHAEKLQQLGPVLERLQSEFLDVVIERTYSIMESFDMIPPPPKEIQGMDWKVEYISLLAQAQKMTNTAGIEQLAGFIGGLSGVNPEVLDKFDMDEAVDQYAEIIGVNPELVRTDDDVAKLREMRSQAQAQQAQAQQMGALAAGAKTLSETKMNTNSALDVLTGAPAR